MNDIENGKTTLFPRWKQASIEIKALNLKPGDIVSNDTLRGMLGFLKQADEKLSFAEFQEMSLLFMRDSKSLRDELLNEYQMGFRTLQGQGWELLAANEQTKHAIHETHKDLMKAANKALALLINTNYELLDSTEQAENTNGLARMTHLKKLLSSERRIDFKDFKQLAE